MKFVRNIEDFFERYIEGFFNKKFYSGLQPVEIAKQLAKEMENGRSVGASKVYAPNIYHIYLNKEDYERILPYQQSVSGELSSYLQELAQEKGYIIIGDLLIQIDLDNALERGDFRVKSDFSEKVPVTEKVTEDTVCQAFSDTLVFEKVSSIEPKKARVLGSLTVVEGIDAGLKVDIGTGRVNIGRRESSEMPLTDMNISRLHSYITYEDGVHIIHDAKSLNGTYLNGHRVVRKHLQSGETIRVGNSIILYEVK